MKKILFLVLISMLGFSVAKADDDEGWRPEQPSENRYTETKFNPPLKVDPPTGETRNVPAESVSNRNNSNKGPQ